MLRPIENVLSLDDDGPDRKRRRRNIKREETPGGRPTPVSTPEDTVSTTLREDTTPVLPCKDDGPVLLSAQDNKTGNIPVLIVEMICQRVREEMQSSEGLMGFPSETESRWIVPGAEDYERRCRLKIMSLVHSKWRILAQDVLRSRIFLPASKLQEFVGGALCAASVRELQFWKPDFSQNERRYTMREEVGFFDKAFKRMPNIQAMSIVIEYSYSLFYSALHAIPQAYPLQALHVSVGGWSEDMLKLFCRVVSRLPKLEALSIIRDSECNAVMELSRDLDRICPPSSLKRLLLETKSTGQLPGEVVSWFLRARGTYALEELRVRQWKPWDGDGFGDPIAPFSSIEEPLSHLKTLEVRVWAYRNDQYLSDEYVCMSRSQEELIEKCTSLEELHANVIDMQDFSLPRTLQRLHVFKRLGLTTPHAEDDERLSSMLTSKLDAGELPNLNALYISSPPLRSRGPQPHLVKSEDVCKKFKIAYKMLHCTATLPECTWRRIY